MLAGLSDLTSDPRAEVRSCALEVLFDLLNERGSKFSSSFWENIFQRVLFPIFDNVRHAGKESFTSNEEGWVLESSVHSLQLLCNLFNTFYKVRQAIDEIYPSVAILFSILAMVLQCELCVFVVWRLSILLVSYSCLFLLPETLNI